MGLMETAKEIASIAQKIDNIDLVKRIMELQEQVFAQVDENRNLKEEVRALKARLETRDQMVFRRNSYWRGDDGPFCPRCFDAEALPVRMLVAYEGTAPCCPKCNTVAMDPEKRSSASFRLERG
jgi:hypothetical protein